jgi:hypothetical protein
MTDVRVPVSKAAGGAGLDADAVGREQVFVKAGRRLDLLARRGGSGDAGRRLGGAGWADASMYAGISRQPQRLTSGESRLTVARVDGRVQPEALRGAEAGARLVASVFGRVDVDAAAVEQALAGRAVEAFSARRAEALAAAGWRASVVHEDEVSIGSSRVKADG